jgi:C-terminal processing protease CtpA/Prc
MDEKTAREVIQRIADLLEEKYVFPDVGKQVADHLRQRLVDGGIAPTLSPPELAEVLTETFSTLTHDSHLRLDHDPARASGGDDTEELMRRHFEGARRNNFGFIKAERLAGNIGYLVLREFPPTEVAMTIAVGAMAFVANTRALIFDIRGHKGGSPEMIQLLISYLVGEEPQPLSGIYSRATGETKTFQTLSEIPGKRMSDVPVYVLVDRQTHSAAEAFAYDLQALKRAQVIGERTRGGAHLVDFIPLKDMFVFMLPIARAVNPITRGNWQGTGVLPDVETTPDGALQFAHTGALRELLVSANDAGERAFLQAEMENLPPY